MYDEALREFRYIKQPAENKKLQNLRNYLKITFNRLNQSTKKSLLTLMRIISTRQSTQMVANASKLVHAVGNRSKLNIKKIYIIFGYVITFKDIKMYEKKSAILYSTVVKKIPGF